MVRIGRVQCLDRRKDALSLKLRTLKLYDLSGFKLPRMAPAFFAEVLVVEVFVAELFTQGQPRFAGPKEQSDASAPCAGAQDVWTLQSLRGFRQTTGRARRTTVPC